jgi:hypothetical protein
VPRILAARSGGLTPGYQTAPGQQVHMSDGLPRRKLDGTITFANPEIPDLTFKLDFSEAVPYRVRFNEFLRQNWRSVHYASAVARGDWEDDDDDDLNGNGGDDDPGGNGDNGADDDPGRNGDDGYWQLVRTIPEPGDESAEGYSGGVLCSSITATWGEGMVSTSTIWPASPRDNFFSCENSRNMSYAGSARWTPPPARLDPGTEIQYEATAETTTSDTVWPHGIGVVIWHGNSRVCSVNVSAEGVKHCEHDPVTVTPGSPLAGESGTTLEVSFLISIPSTWSVTMSGEYDFTGRYTYVYEWVP